MGGEARRKARDRNNSGVDPSSRVVITIYKNIKVRVIIIINKRERKREKRKLSLMRK